MQLCMQNVQPFSNQIWVKLLWRHLWMATNCKFLFYLPGPGRPSGAIFPSSNWWTSIRCGGWPNLDSASCPWGDFQNDGQPWRSGNSNSKVVLLCKNNTGGFHFSKNKIIKQDLLRNQNLKYLAIRSILKTHHLSYSLARSGNFYFPTSQIKPENATRSL